MLQVFTPWMRGLPLTWLSNRLVDMLASTLCRHKHTFIRQFMVVELSGSRSHKGDKLFDQELISLSAAAQQLYG